MRASRGLKWENKTYKLKRSISPCSTTKTFWELSYLISCESARLKLKRSISSCSTTKTFWDLSYLISCESARLPPTLPSTSYGHLIFGFFIILLEIKSSLPVSPLGGAVCPSIDEFHWGVRVFPQFSKKYRYQDLGPVSQKCRKFSGLLRVPQFPLYLRDAEVLSHQTSQSSWFFLH